jgi:type IV pilus assembly protein PilW
MKKTINNIYHQAGFTLVELMVGLVIGLIATVVIMQTFASFEGTKRSTTGIADAQTNGSIALYSIQRELQFAGYGMPLMSGTMPTVDVLPNEMTYADYTGKTEAEILTAQTALLAAYEAKVAAGALKVQAGEVFSALRCDSSSTLALDLDNDPGTADVTIGLNALLTPVTITNGVNGDTVAIRYGTTSRGALPTMVSNVTPPNFIGVMNNMGCREGDVVLVTKEVKSSTACVATKLTAATTNASLEATPNEINVLSNSGMAVGDRLACLGQVRQITFDVNGNQLRRNNTPVISDIVNLQAQYGVSATINSEIVAEWRDAIGGTWATPTVANRNRIKAVRIAVVARNSLLEKDVVSQACTGTATGPARVCAWGADVNLAGTDVGADWNRYRYRVYEVVVPLRNILAATPQL